MNTFLSNARMILRDIDMQHLHPAHGTAVDIVRWCLAVHGRPTHRRQAFLETESPALLAYLEKLAASGNAVGWRTLEDRIQLRAEILRETGTHSCARPWYAAMWHVLPELAGIGQAILDQQAEKDVPAPDLAQTVTETNGGAGGGGGESDKGSGGKAGTTAKPRPALRLAVPAAPVVLTGVEKKALDLGNDASADDKTDAAPEGPDGTNGDGGTRGPGGMGGRR
ncbi:hypothetical protein C8J34_104147 [Rhizobium sp. PP-F2F-G36]|nr:hypothetical protein C8J34_104147 [Rhizobium sp. PP-F2F-G36]